MTEAQYPVAGGAVLCCGGGGGVMQRFGGPGPALLDVSHIGRVLLITDAACCSQFALRLTVCLSSSLCLHLPSSSLHPSASPKRPASHLPPSASPLPIPFCFCSRLSSSVPLSMAALSPVRRPFSPPPPPVALSVLRRHL